MIPCSVGRWESWERSGEKSLSLKTMVNHDCGDEDGKRAGRGAVQLPDTGCSLTRLLRPVGMPNVNVTMVSVWLYWLDCFYMLGMGILQQSKSFSINCTQHLFWLCFCLLIIMGSTWKLVITLKAIAEGLLTCLVVSSWTAHSSQATTASEIFSVP